MNQMNKEIKRYNPNAVYDDLSKSLHDKFSNPSWNGPFLGTVVSAPPDLQVQIDEKIILTKDKIINCSVGKSKRLQQRIQRRRKYRDKYK